MISYIADFRDGSARSKKTNLPFTHAWRVTYLVKGQTACTGGFSSSRTLAEDAAARQAKLIGPARKASSAHLIGVEIVEARRDVRPGAGTVQFPDQIPLD